MKISSTKGFTLIELLVVISIIGLLSTVVLASVNTARAKGRDASRVQTMAQVRNALELYYSDVKSYPSSGSYPTIESLVAIGGPLYTYLKSVPTSLTISGGSATSYLSDGSSYELLVQTETTGTAFSKNLGCFSADYDAYPAPTSNTYCYGNSPTVSLAGNTGVTTFTPPVSQGTVYVVPRVNGYVNTGFSCSTTLSISGSQNTAGCYRSLSVSPDIGTTYQITNASAVGYTYSGATPPTSSTLPPYNPTSLVFYVDFTN